MSKTEFHKALKSNYSDGGIGVNDSLAKTMAEKVSIILKQSEDARRFRRRFMANNFFDRESVLVNRLLKYLANEYDNDLALVQKKRLKELIYNRISGLIPREEFKLSLRQSLEKGGIGVSKAASRKLTNYFEKILIQGSETKGHGH